MALRGDLADLCFAEVLQMLNLGRKSGTLYIDSDDCTGAVHLREGEVVHATAAGSIQAEQAIFQMLGATRGEFEFRPVIEHVPHTVQCSTDSLLLEGMKRMDEWQELERTIGANVPLRVAAADIGERLAHVPPGTLELLRLVDGRRSIADIVKLSGLDPVKALMGVTELVASGVVERCHGTDLAADRDGRIRVGTGANGAGGAGPAALDRSVKKPLLNER